MNADKRVLIVDDEPDILKAVTFRVQRAGYGVISAADGKDGLEKARAEKPDLIILDWQLPVMNGVEVYRELQADPELKDIPVILLTASRERDELEYMRDDVGFKHIVIKPYEPEELLAKISDLV